MITFRMAEPPDWAGFLQRQIDDGKELARMMNMGEDAYAGLQRDKQRYDKPLKGCTGSGSTYGE